MTYHFDELACFDSHKLGVSSILTEETGGDARSNTQDRVEFTDLSNLGVDALTEPAMLPSIIPFQ